MICQSSGPLNAKILILLDMPSKEDNNRGTLLNGPEGRLLQEMLERNSINPRDCYVTSVLSERPYSGNFRTFYTDPAQCNRGKGLHLSIQRLRSDIFRLVNPNIIIAFGNESLRALDNGKRSVDKWRGSILETSAYVPLPRENSKIKFISTYHPRTILKNYIYRTIAEIDIRKAYKEQFTPSINIPKRNFILAPSKETVLSYLANLKEDDIVSFDIETMPNKLIRCLALSKDPLEAICIPFITVSNHTIHPDPSGKSLITTSHTGDTNGNFYNLQDEKEILSALYEFFKNPLIKKTAQNYPFDSTRLAQEFGFVIRGLDMDTLIAQHVLYPELPKNLDFMTTVYTKTPLYSDHNTAYDQSEWEYNAMDACVTREIRDVLTTDLQNSDLYTFYKQHSEPAMIAYTRAQNRGIPTDEKEREKLLNKWTTKLANAKEQVTKRVGFDLNPCSPKQVHDWLYLREKVPIHRNHKTKKPSTDEKTLIKIRGKFPNLSGTIDKILDYRGAKKMIGTFLKKDLVDGKTLTTYNIAGTVTGRLSSSQTLWKEGVNITQTPKNEMRRMFHAPDGYIWLHSDLSQAEARFVFWDAGVHEVIEHYMDDPSFDIYKWNAAKNLYHIHEHNVTKDQRSIAKVGVLGGNYGLGPKLAAATYRVSVKDATLALEGYHNGIPHIKQWWQRIESEINSTRTLTTPLGRRRQFLGRLDQFTYRSAYAYRPQSTIGDIVHRAWTFCDKNLPKGSFPIIPVHDEINILALEKDLPECIRVLRDAYHCPLNFNTTKHPLDIPVEISTGPNWWDQEEIII